MTRAQQLADLHRAFQSIASPSTLDSLIADLDGIDRPSHEERELRQQCETALIGNVGYDAAHEMIAAHGQNGCPQCGHNLSERMTIEAV